MELGALEQVAGGRVSHPLPLGGDERLARLVGEGSQRAFTALYERYHQRLYQYCRSMLHNDADAQDALQSAFAKAFGALRGGHRDAPLRPWLYRIAHNEAITLIRRRRPEVALTAVPDETAPSASDVAGQRARLALLVADLGELTERQRGALVMRELSGLSHEEIEAALELSSGTAKPTILEARRSLAEFAQGRAMICDEVCRTISDGNGRTLRGRRIRAHLRDCSGCAAFAAAIPNRSHDLRALAPPLPAAAAAGLLARTLGTGSSHGGGSGITAGLGAKAVGLASTKVLAVAAVVVTATAATGVVKVLSAGSVPRPASVSSSRPRAAGRPSGVSRPSGAGQGTSAAAASLGGSASRSGVGGVGPGSSTAHSRARGAGRGTARGYGTGGAHAKSVLSAHGKAGASVNRVARAVVNSASRTRSTNTGTRAGSKTAGGTHASFQTTGRNPQRSHTVANPRRLTRAAGSTTIPGSGNVALGQSSSGQIVP